MKQSVDSNLIITKILALDYKSKIMKQERRERGNKEAG